MKLAPFQKDAIDAAYGDGGRAFAMMISKGNGKSTLLAGMALHALFDPDDSGEPQIPIVAVALHQAERAVFNVAKSMVAACDDLADRSTFYSAIGAKKIVTPYNGGEVFPISADVDGLQGLDPSFAVVDELGFIPSESWDAVLLASGKRPRSLVVGIGTPGFDRHSALFNLWRMDRDGTVPPGVRFVGYSADDGCELEDEDQWLKANPAIAEGFSAIDGMRISVKTTPETTFRLLRLGQWVEGGDGWLGENGWALWNDLEDRYEMVLGAPTFVGVDIGLRRDSTAIVWCQRRDDGRLHVKAKIWAPRADGRLDVTDAMEHLRRLNAAYDVKAVHYDRHLFELAAQQLADEGLPMLDTPQTLDRMTPIVGATYEAIRTGGISHDGDELFGSQVLAAVAKFNPRGFTLEKRKARDRIDAAIALCLAVHATEAPVPGPVDPASQVF